MAVRAQKAAVADGRTADAILDAAEQLIRQHGMSGLKLTAIAELVGVTHPLIFHHFGSKHGLIDAIARRHASNLRESLVKLLEADPHGPPAVHLILERMQKSLLDDGFAALTQWGLKQRPDIVQPAINDFMQKVTEAAIARRIGNRPDQDPEAIRAEIRQIVHAAALLMWGQALVGASLNAAMGFAPDDRAAGRDYLAMLLLQRLLST